MMERCDFCSAMKMIREYISDERGFDQSEILYRFFENFFRSVEDGWIMGRYAKEKNELYGMEQVALRQKKEMPHFAAQQAILRLEELRSTLHDDGQALNNWLNEMRRSFMDTAIYSFNRA